MGVGAQVTGWGPVLIWMGEHHQQVVGGGAGSEEEEMSCSSCAGLSTFHKVDPNGI